LPKSSLRTINYPQNSLRLTNKEGKAGRRHTVVDNRTRSEDLLGGDVRSERNTHLQVKVSGDEQRQYQGKWSLSMLADYCWTLKSDFPQAAYSRKSTRVTF
jgi:hypothetical protein